MTANYRLTIAAIAIMLSGCGQHSSDNMLASGQMYDAKPTGILSAMRPGVDPALVERLRQEQRSRQIAQPQVQGNGPQSVLVGLGRLLPKVSTGPISHSNDPVAPPAEEVSQTGAVVTSATQAATEIPMPMANPYPVQQAASYGGYYGVPSPPPGAIAGSLVPPPPAVTLATQVQSIPNPYANPYLNPYGIPVPPNWQGQQAAAAQAAAPEPERPAGLFGNGRGSGGGSDDDTDSRSSKKRADFVPLTPTGMEARSAYKQRDDLKMLWKGAISASVNGDLANEPKVLAQLGKIDANLPNESSKGSFTISQRQIDAIFKPAAIDKRVFPQVRKVQTELVQSYYRYLYAYNKYALAQQTVAARKQEVEYADSPSEKQRATTDLAQAQSDAEASKDDMHSAQYELANASSPAAARTIIGKVSGITPSVEALKQTELDTIADASGKLVKLNGVLTSLFHHHDKHDKAVAVAEAKKEKASSVSEEDKAAAKKSAKHADNRAAKDDAAAGKDLSPAPSDDTSLANSDDKSRKVASAATPGGRVHFLLQDVHVTARKSILSVAVKNTGLTAMNFDPDQISASEGNHKLSDASMRAEFDSTSVDPNQEVKGTITIFGRPWSDHVAVYLSDNGKLVQLRR